MNCECMHGSSCLPPSPPPRAFDSASDKANAPLSKAVKDGHTQPAASSVKAGALGPAVHPDTKILTIRHMEHQNFTDLAMFGPVCVGPFR